MIICLCLLGCLFCLFLRLGNGWFFVRAWRWIFVWCRFGYLWMFLLILWLLSDVDGLFWVLIRTPCFVEYVDRLSLRSLWRSSLQLFEVLNQLSIHIIWEALLFLIEWVNRIVVQMFKFTELFQHVVALCIQLSLPRRVQFVFLPSLVQNASDLFIYILWLPEWLVFAALRLNQLLFYVHRGLWFVKGALALNCFLMLGNRLNRSFGFFFRVIRLLG